MKWYFALFLLLPLSGCLGEEPAASLDALLLPAQCMRSDVDCTDEPERLIVQGLRLQDPAGRAQVGVRILAADKDIVIRDSHIEGYPIGILHENSACTDCQVRLENVTLVGPESETERAGPYWLRDAGLVDLHIPGQAVADWVLRDVTVQGYPSAIVVMAEDGEGRSMGRFSAQSVSISCVRNGIQAARAYVEMMEVTVTGCKGQGIVVGLAEDAALSRLNVSHSWLGLNFRSDHDGALTLQDSVFTHNDGGGLYVQNRQHVLSRLLVEANGAGRDVDQYEGFPLDRLYGLATPFPGSLTDSCIQDNHAWGLYAFLPPGETYNVPGNWWGDAWGPRRAMGGDGYQQPEPIVGPGSGDVVSLNVVADPPLQAPSSACT